jgi:hypothetical protein
MRRGLNSAEQHSTNADDVSTPRTAKSFDFKPQTAKTAIGLGFTGTGRDGASLHGLIAHPPKRFLSHPAGRDSGLADSELGQSALLGPASTNSVLGRFQDC